MYDFKTYLILKEVGFNITRSQMPQIKNEDFKKWLESKGHEVSLVDDVDINFVKPLQQDYDIAKVKSMSLNLEPVFIASDGYILDGHHRYFKKKLFSNRRTISCYQTPNLTINKLLSLAYEYLGNSNENI